MLKIDNQTIERVNLIKIGQWVRVINHWGGGYLVNKNTSLYYHDVLLCFGWPMATIMDREIAKNLSLIVTA